MTKARDLASNSTGSKPKLVDAKGDLLVGTAADTAGRLAVGANTYLLTADSAEATGMKWAAPTAATFVGCRLDKTAAQTIASGTWTALTFDVEDYDTDGFHSNTTNNSRITIPSGKSGYYLVQAQITWAANSTGYRLSYVDANATGNPSSYLTWDPVTFTGRFTQYYSFTDYLTAADYYQIFVIQNSGSNVNVDGRNYSQFATSFQVSFLGA